MDLSNSSSYSIWSFAYSTNEYELCIKIKEIITELVAQDRSTVKPIK